jgi:hypothetical protein
MDASLRWHDDLGGAALQKTGVTPAKAYLYRG